MAAKAPCFVPWICFTALNWSWTWELSPPSLGLPQVTTDPSARQQMHNLPEAAAHFKVAPGLWRCPQNVECPKLRPIHSARQQQMHSPWPESAVCSSVDLEFQSCCHHAISVAPGSDWAILQDRGEFTDPSDPSAKWELSPPFPGSPHVTILSPPQHQ
jgi:hypothetical protein